MRQITNWTKEQIEEFRLLENHTDSPMTAIHYIINKDIGTSEYPELHNRYALNDDIDDIPFAQDIIDLMNGNAEFKENKYVFLLNGIKPANNARYAITRNDQTGKTDFCFYVENYLTYSWLQFTEHEAKQLINQAGLHYDDFEKIEVPADD